MAEQTPLYLDPDAPLDDRVEDLLSRMTFEEKVSQMTHKAKPVERLGIPEYNWWNEALHGVARAGRATVFPQAIGMAASWNTGLMRRVADAIGDEGRAKHHQALRQGNRSQYFGLTFWSPNINIFRDPRWGRGHETYGECPYLTGRMGIAFVRGLQGDDPHYLKTAACAKHYAVHSGPEEDRHHFDARVSPRDLWETYLPAFRDLVEEAKVESVMGAYNRTNGEVCCGSPTLLGEILRGMWGFDGHVVSDCWAVLDFHKHHQVTADEPESAALAVNNGCDVNCGCTFPALLVARDRGIVSEEAVTASARRLLRTRFKLGMFDPPERVPYAQTPPEVVGCKMHRRINRQMARESVVLLKNEQETLPLRTDLNNVLVVGPTAQSPVPLRANYFGHGDRLTTIWEGIVGKLSAGTQVHYRQGCPLTGDGGGDFANLTKRASHADVVIACMGLTTELEGEEGAAVDSDAGGDRRHIGLPGRQEELLKALHASGTPVVLVLTGGSALAVNWAQENLPAILMAWYPGQEGGEAVADVLFGEYNPAGRLPVTFPKSLEQVPDFRDYAMAGRTYRFMDAEPLYRFGYGLSYTRFEYSDPRLAPAGIAPDGSVAVSVEVANVGPRAGDEVVQCYLSAVEASVPAPRCQLAGFRRLHLPPGGRETVAFRIDPDQLAVYDDDGAPRVEPGTYRISLGGGQPDDPAAGAVTAELTVT